MEDVTYVVIILKLSVTCFSNVVKYNTYGKFALKKMKVFVPNEQLSLTYTLLVIGSVPSKHKTIINTFLFETKFMIWKCRNYKTYEHSVFLNKKS